MKEKYIYSVCVVGGCGHVGLPLALTLADAGYKTAILDVDLKRLAKVRSGVMPFMEKGAAPMLKKALRKDLLSTYSDKKVVSQSEYIIIVIGTPMDDHLNPRMQDVLQIMTDLLPTITPGQTIILRSTIYPGTTRIVADLLKKNRKKVKVAFCPERVAEGIAIEEIKNLPQIISGVDSVSTKSAKRLFSKIVDDVIELTPEEAELSKLFTNSWRYIQFAIANQFFMIADQRGLDFHKILHAVKFKYPRAKDFPGAGFTAGPCLLKDTMQLASLNSNQFFLGHAAMMVNEGLPNYIVTKLKGRFDLKKKRVGILGMAFKGDNDDPRDSLSYKLKKLLEIEAKEVLCSDPFITDPSFVTENSVRQRSDIIILATPHTAYRRLRSRPNQKVVDIWDFWGKGSVI